MFKLLSFGSSIFSGSILYIGKALTICLVIYLMVNPQALSSMPVNLKMGLGMLAITFAVFGLIACCFSFSHVALIAGFWMVSIYFLSTALLPGASRYVKGYNPSALISKVTSNPGAILNTSFDLSQLASAVDFQNLGLGSSNGASFKNISYNSGVLPDSAYFPASNAKGSFYPMKDQKSILGNTSLTSILQMLPAK